MSAVGYRDAVIDDATAVADVFRCSFVDTFGHLYSAEDLAEFLATTSVERFRADMADDRFTIHVAIADGLIAGYVKLGPPDLPVETPPATLQLCQLYVLKAWQGEGVAAALMDWTLLQARARQSAHIQLSVFVDNLRARRFYERYGFVPVGRYDFRVGNHVDDDVVLRHVVLQADR